MPTPSVEPRTALVTGCSSGIGLATAALLAFVPLALAAGLTSAGAFGVALRVLFRST